MWSEKNRPLPPSSTGRPAAQADLNQLHVWVVR